MIYSKKKKFYIKKGTSLNKLSDNIKFMKFVYKLGVHYFLAIKFVLLNSQL